MLKKFIGDKKFYKMTMAVAVPIMIQNFITNFVSMLDNIMVGQVGTAPMSGVAIVNQVLFVLNLCVFGAVSGAGIFTAQYAGSGDHEGVRNTFRFKLLSVLLLVAVGIGVFAAFGEQLVSLWLRGEGSAEDAAAFLRYGMSYMRIMLLGLPAFAVANVYCSTLRESGETVVPMTAGVIAVFVNLCLNYILIFGHLGFRPMGVRGAAVATVVSRYVELMIAAAWTHTHKARMPFAEGLYRTFRMPRALVGQIIRKGTPLLLNEGLWAAGMAMLNQCYSIRGLDVVAAMNISSTIWNAMGVAFMAMGNAVGIILGHKLGEGAGQDEVMDQFVKLTAFTIVLNCIFGVALAGVSGVFPLLYSTTDEVRSLATRFILVEAYIMPFAAYTNCTYFALRSGGKTVITFIFDSCFVWAVHVPLAFCLSRFTGIPVVPLYFISQSTELIKCAIGTIMIRRRTWMQSIII